MTEEDISDEAFETVAINMILGEQVFVRVSDIEEAINIINGREYSVEEIDNTIASLEGRLNVYYKLKNIFDSMEEQPEKE